MECRRGNIADGKETFSDFITRVKAASLSVCKAERSVLDKATEFFKAFLEARMQEFVTEHRDAPLRQSYQGDATASLQRVRWFGRIGLARHLGNNPLGVSFLGG